jgi:endo-beta-N-acetylglucosaminidase D
MTVVTSKEFAINKDTYFDMAMNEDVFVQRDNIMFIVARAGENNKKKHLQDDDNLRRAISPKTTKLSDKYRGVFTKEVGKNFIEHTKTMREEWNSI